MDLSILLAFLLGANSAAPGFSSGDNNSYSNIEPLIKKYCLKCHSGAKSKGDIRLDQDHDNNSVRNNLETWRKAWDNIHSGDMPPANEKKLTPKENALLNRWFEEVVFKPKFNSSRNPGKTTIRRLNRNEYFNTVRDLLGIEYKPARDFPADDVGYGFDNIGDVLSLPPILMEKYFEAAQSIIDEALRKPEIRKKLVPTLGGFSNRFSTRENINHFARRAWRRPLASIELDRLMELVRLAKEQGENGDNSAKVALQAVLVSPFFLFRVEQDNNTENGLISPFELATRLSYFLWSSMPDEELFELAQLNKLKDPLILKNQIQRMLKDPKGKALADNFASQWLNLRSFTSFHPDPRLFPSFTNELREDMLRETELYFRYVIRENRSILDFIQSDYTFLNARLATHYGIDGIKGNEFRKINLKNGERGGIITQSSVLAVTSNPTRTSPVKRGKWILENILGTPPPPPPQLIEELKENEEITGTLRQKMELHRKNPNCSGCHARMDPLGFGLENYDVLGRWRTKEGKYSIDPSGVLPDGAIFTGPSQLRAILLNKKDLFLHCFSGKLLTFALGRGLESSDRDFLDEIVQAAQKDNYKIGTIIESIVVSDPFQKRASTGKMP